MLLSLHVCLLATMDQEGLSVRPSVCLFVCLFVCSARLAGPWNIRSLLADWPHQLGNQCGSRTRLTRLLVASSLFSLGCKQAICLHVVLFVGRQVQSTQHHTIQFAASYWTTNERCKRGLRSKVSPNKLSASMGQASRSINKSPLRALFVIYFVLTNG